MDQPEDVPQVGKQRLAGMRPADERGVVRADGGAAGSTGAAVTRRRFLSSAALGLGALGLPPTDSASNVLPAAALPDAATRPEIGMFYTSWWETADKTHEHWDDVRRRGWPVPSLGYYNGYDRATIQAQYNAMRECGVDFVIFDDTNCIFVGKGLVDRIIRGWFDFMDDVPPSGRLRLCIAFGGELNQYNDKKRFLEAADYIWKTYAQRPSHLRMDGKPLALWYIEKDTISDWQDPRFTVRRCYHAFRTGDQAKHEGWGWGSAPTPPANEECMSFFPGWTLDRTIMIDRKGGNYYCECWLRVLKAKPRYVAIADWNNWQERTAIEDCPAWTDTHGASTPDWYRQITQAYASLRTGKLLHGFYYREELEPEVYYYSRRHRLVHFPGYPDHKAVIITPDGWLTNVPKIEWPGKLEP